MASRLLVASFVTTLVVGMLGVVPAEANDIVVHTFDGPGWIVVDLTGGSMMRIDVDIESQSRGYAVGTIWYSKATPDRGYGSYGGVADGERYLHVSLPGVGDYDYASQNRSSRFSQPFPLEWYLEPGDHRVILWVAGTFSRATAKIQTGTAPAPSVVAQGDGAWFVRAGDFDWTGTPLMYRDGPYSAGVAARGTFTFDVGSTLVGFAGWGSDDVAYSERFYIEAQGSEFECPCVWGPGAGPARGAPGTYRLHAEADGATIGASTDFFIGADVMLPD